MKKFLAIFTALVLISNLFAFPVFAEETSKIVDITSVYSASAGTEYEIGEEIVITGTITKTGRDIVLRIYNDKGSLVFTDVISAVDNTEQTFVFKGFKLPAVSETKAEGTYTYRVVVNTTAKTGEQNEDVVDSENMTVKIGKKSDDYRGVGVSIGNVSVTNTIPWNEPESEDTEDTEEIISDVTGEIQKSASEDPINSLVVGEAAQQTTASGAAKFIEAATKATDPAAMAWESTRSTIAVSVETMMANIGSKKISTSSSTNTLVLKESSVSDSDLKKYTDTEKTLTDAMKKNNITLNRELSKEYIVNTTFSTTKKANITVYKGFVEKLEKVGIETLTINDAKFRVSYSMTELKEMIGDNEFTSFDIDTTAMSGSSKKLAVSFDTDKTQSVKISFPGLSSDAKYMAIVDENGNPVGGRYNPATGAIEAKISESGVYQVINNEKDFEDIKHLSEEMQESIKILAAKGIIEGTSPKEFSPEDSISRAEVAALLLRVLAQVDPNADGGFADVKKSDWFYGTAGSSKKYGMILGYNDNTFRGNTVISKDQILTVASRVLQREMKYIAPEKPEEWLTFNDSSSIADWAKNDIALATMANIITRTADNTIHANENMTRGDAALIIMRLFYKIW